MFLGVPTGAWIILAVIVLLIVVLMISFMWPKKKPVMPPTQEHDPYWDEEQERIQLRLEALYGWNFLQWLQARQAFGANCGPAPDHDGISPERAREIRQEVRREFERH